MFGAWAGWTDDWDAYAADVANKNYCPYQPMMTAFVILILKWVNSCRSCSSFSSEAFSIRSSFHACLCSRASVVVSLVAVALLAFPNLLGPPTMLEEKKSVKNHQKQWRLNHCILKSLRCFDIKLN